MTERDGSTRGGSDPARGPDDGIGRLVRAAGARAAAPEAVADRVRAAVRDDWRRVVTRRLRARRLAWGGGALAAAALVAIAGLGVREAGRGGSGSSGFVATVERVAGPVRWPEAAAPGPGAGLAAGTTLATGDGGRVALRLGGGAPVRVDAGSSLTLVSGREILLERGRIYLETGTAPESGGIVVRTPLGTVRDIGTRFQVRVGENVVEVSVRDGSAVLETRGAAHRASPGTRIAVRGDGTINRETIPSSGSAWDWILDIAPPFALEGRTLGEYLDWVGRETGLQIGYSDATILRDLSTVVLHGSIAGLRPDESLDAILPTCGLRHAIHGDSLVIARAAPGRPEPAQ
jgi:ferric-dicitrate binding protein FerR (iron transport regulator)